MKSERDNAERARRLVEQTDQANAAAADAALGRRRYEFTPTQAGKMSDLFPNHQRVWRLRFKAAGLDFPDAPYDLDDVLDMAIAIELSARMLSPADAWRIATSLSRRTLERIKAGPVVVFYVRDGAEWKGYVAAGSFEFDTADPRWRSSGGFFNYTAIRERVDEAHNRLFGSSIDWSVKP